MAIIQSVACIETVQYRCISMPGFDRDSFYVKTGESGQLLCQNETASLTIGESESIT